MKKTDKTIEEVRKANREAQKRWRARHKARKTMRIETLSEILTSGLSTGEILTKLEDICRNRNLLED